MGVTVGTKYDGRLCHAYPSMPDLTLGAVSFFLPFLFDLFETREKNRRSIDEGFTAFTYVNILPVGGE